MGDLVARLRKALAEYDQAVEWHSYRRHDVDREAEQHKAAARLAEIVREALTSQQHAEPAAGEVEVVAWAVPWTDGRIGGLEFYHGSSMPENIPHAFPLVTKSSYDALDAAKDREISELEEIARNLTKALVDLTPGGSEYFVQRGENYYADTEACVRVVRERYDSGHQAKIERVDLRRQRDALREVVKPFAEAAEKYSAIWAEETGAQDEADRDDEPVQFLGWLGMHIDMATLGDFRRARAAFEEDGGAT